MYVGGVPPLAAARHREPSQGVPAPSGAAPRWPQTVLHVALPGIQLPLLLLLLPARLPLLGSAPTTPSQSGPYGVSAPPAHTLHAFFQLSSWREDQEC